MIQSVDNLKCYPIVILMYRTGSSGEFIAGALTQSIPAFVKTQEEWIGPGRKNFADALGKTLNGGWQHIVNEDVVKRFNWYLEVNQPQQNLLQLVLSHPDQSSLDFIQQYLNHAPIIEITTHNPISTKFMSLARRKVSYEDFIAAGDKTILGRTKEQYKNILNRTLLFHNHGGYQAHQHIHVEWESLMISDTEKSFNHICNFLNCAGSVDYFKSLVKEYIDRNQYILDQIQI
jgi:hypothetical protein